VSGFTTTLLLSALTAPTRRRTGALDPDRR
jgi:hypothetical protein